MEDQTGVAPDWPGSVTGRLLDLAVDLACVASFEGYFVELSDGWSDLLGFDVAELSGRPFLDFVHPDDVARTSDQLAAAREGRDLTRFQNRFVAADGRVLWLMWTAIALPGAQRYHAVARDLTPQHDAEELTRESERRYLDLIESSHDIVQSITPDGHFEFVNRAWHDHLGYSPEELPELTLFDIVDPGDHDHCNIVIGQLMGGMNLEQVEVTFVAKDGRRFPVEGNASGRFRDGEYVATHAFFRDISERREAERLTAEYQRQLEAEVAERTTALVQSEKLATLGRLSAGMAHELNNPAAAAQRGAVRLREAITETARSFFDLAELGLTSADASLLAEMVARSAERAKVPDGVDPVTRSDRESEVEDWLDANDLDDAWELAAPVVSLGLGVEDLDDLAARFQRTQLPLVLALMSQSHTAYALLEQIAQGSQRVSEIVTALKDYSYMDRAPVQDVDVHEGIDSTLVMLQAKLKQGVDVVRDYCSDLPRIEARGSELNQVWTNLIDNAVDAMDGSGHIVVRTTLVGDTVVVEVEDDGPGIDPEHLGKVFDPFFTTKLPGQGTGLGLNITFNIVRGFGGRLEVDSAPGRTVFRVHLPVQRAVTDDGPDDGNGSAGSVEAP